VDAVSAHVSELQRGFASVVDSQFIVIHAFYGYDTWHTVCGVVSKRGGLRVRMRVETAGDGGSTCDSHLCDGTKRAAFMGVEPLGFKALLL
jgi:hypothetical protein